MVIQVGNVKGSAESNENLGPNRKNTNIRRNASEPQASSAPPIMRVVAGAGAAAPCMDRHERSQPADAGTVKVYILDQWWWWLEPVRLWPGFVSADGPINFHPPVRSVCRFFIGRWSFRSTGTVPTPFILKAPQ